MNIDPLASMRCWAVDLTIGDHLFTIPALPAADWWPVLAEGDLNAALDLIGESCTCGAHRAEPFPLTELLWPGAGVTDLREVLTEAIEDATGRSLHASLVIAATAAASWPGVGGETIKRGFRWDEQPIGAALDLLHLIIMSSLPEEQKAEGKGPARRPRDEYLALLDREDITTGKPSEQQRAAQLDTFAAMAGPKPTAGVRSSGAPSGGARSRSRPRPRPRRPAGQ